MKFKKVVAILISLILTSSLLTSCIFKKDKTTAASKNAPTSLIDNKEVYKMDNDNGVINLYVTIPQNQGDKKYTFSDLDKDTNPDDDFEPELNVIFQEGDETGPKEGLIGYGLTEANGKMRIRGRSTRATVEKSFKIVLNDKLGLWHGNKSINLNRHPYDITKIRNKISFDYFKEITNLVSFRTQFVNLHIKDLSSNDKSFKNYGLYTHIEQANKDFLKNHGLDPTGNLYKAQFFLFLENKDSLKNVKDTGYDKKAFEKILEIKAGKDHQKLLKMLADVNNEKNDIDDVIKRHFNRENYLTWLATNIIMGNLDTNSQNFYLYSPSNASNWYFIPWDYDGAWGFYDQTGINKMELSPWQSGASNYFGVTLHKRFLSKKQNIDDLTKKIEELSKIINYENTLKKLENAYNIASKYMSVSERKAENVNIEIQRIANQPKENIKKYYESLEKPMPVFTGGPYDKGDDYVFTCTKSVDLKGNDVYYDFEIAKDPEFKEVIHKVKDYASNEFEVEKTVLSKGIYYFKITIKNSNGNSQVSFDRYDAENGKQYFGVKQFKVE